MNENEFKQKIVELTRMYLGISLDLDTEIQALEIRVSLDKSPVIKGTLKRIMGHQKGHYKGPQKPGEEDNA